MHKKIYLVNGIYKSLSQKDIVGIRDTVSSKSNYKFKNWVIFNFKNKYFTLYLEVNIRYIKDVGNIHINTVKI